MHLLINIKIFIPDIMFLHIGKYVTDVWSLTWNVTVHAWFITEGLNDIDLLRFHILLTTNYLHFQTPVQMLFMWSEFLYDLYVSQALVCSFLPYTVKTDQTSHNWENQNQLRHMWRHKKKKKKKSEQIQGVKQFAYFFVQWPVGCSPYLLIIAWYLYLSVFRPHLL